MREKVLNSLRQSLPYLIISLITFGIIFSWAIHRFDLLIRGMSLAIPGILSSIVLLNIYKKQSDPKNPIIAFKFNQRILKSLFGILFILSIWALSIISYRPWYYFILLSILYGLIFIQILSKNFQTSVILCEIMLLMLNLIYGLILKYAFYFSGTDINAHIFLSEVVYITGNTIPETLDVYYAQFPLYHIFIAEISYLTGLDIKISLFVTSILYVTTVVFIYYLFNQTIHNKQIQLLTCLLYSTSSIVIFYGSYVITRTMAFVGFIILLYLFYKGIRGMNKIIYKILAFILAVFLILVHQVSMIPISILLFIILICESIFKIKHISKNFLLVFNVMFIGYWFFTAYRFTESIVISHTKPKNMEEIIITQVRASNEIGFLLNSIDVSIFVFFALIGIGYILYNRKLKYAPILGLFALITFVFYVPTPLNMVWQVMNLFRVDRFALFVSPFMAFVMGYGIYVFISALSGKDERHLKSIAVLSLIFIMLFSFTSSFNELNASDSDDFFTRPHKYFNEKELKTFDFIEANVPYNSNLYSDYFVKRYHVNKKISELKYLNIPFYKSAIYKPEDSSKYNGYIIIRNEEFYRVGLYLGSMAHHPLHIPTNENEHLLYSSLQKKDKIYSSYAVDVHKSA